MASLLQKLKNKSAALATILRNSRDVRTGHYVLADMVRKRLRAVRLRHNVKRLHGPATPPGGPRDVVATCMLRDGMEHLPTFLRHHREIGVKHFVILDNGSVDGTVNYLQQQPDVTLLISDLPFADYKHLIKRLLVRTCGTGRWVLILDVDECFDFPGSDRIALNSFCEYLDGRGFTAVVGQMLEMFPDGPVMRQEAPHADADLREIHQHYDISQIKEDEHLFAFGDSNTVSNPEIKCLSCGINMQVFGNDTLLTKHPLIRWQPPLELPKYSHDVSYARIADVSAVLYHYKFTAGVTAVIERALHEGGYYLGSQRYRNIERVFRKNPDLNLRGPTARRLESADALVEQGFLRVSKAYTDWLAGRRS